MAGDTNGRQDIFVHDRETRETTLVSGATDGTQSDGDSGRPAISADGRFVSFESWAANLVPGTSGGHVQVFVRDLQTGETTLVSRATDGTHGNADSRYSAISGNGRFLVFGSRASNLVPGDNGGQFDVFVHDRQTGKTTRVSTAADGTPGDRGGDVPLSISEDGGFISFTSASTNLVPGDTNRSSDAFVATNPLLEVEVGRTLTPTPPKPEATPVPLPSRFTVELVSVASDGAQGNGFSGHATISGDGRFVAFMSAADSLVPNDTNENPDIFVRDWQTGKTERVSVASDGTQADSGSTAPSISTDGRFVAFQSSATNLVPGDTNRAEESPPPPRKRFLLRLRK